LYVHGSRCGGEYVPELPEVETVVRLARPRMVGRRIVAFESRWARQVSPGVEQVREAVCGSTVVSVTRRGKFIVAHLRRGGRDVGGLMIHLRMSGRFEWGWTVDAPAVEPTHVRATFDLDDGARLYFCDARKFGRILFNTDANATGLALGPEPLDRAFTPAKLAALLRARKRSLKPLLLDQSVIAGLGNIYTDEALFRAGLHPLRKSSSLRPEQVTALHEAIRHVLRQGIRHNGASLDWVYPDGQMQKHLMVYGRAGESCRRCGDEIAALRVGQRGTHVCPTCQPKRGLSKKPLNRRGAKSAKKSPERISI
jgi:formamidopyrimidine-DNA glycosylase